MIGVCPRLSRSPAQRRRPIPRPSPKGWARGDPGPLPRADRLAAPQARQGGARRGRRDRPPGPRRDLRAADRRGASGTPPLEFHYDQVDPDLQVPPKVVRRDQPGSSCSASSRSTAATSSAGSSTAPGSRCSSRSSPRCWRSAVGTVAGVVGRLFRRLDRHPDQPHDGRLPRVPDPAVRARAGRHHPGPGVRPAGRHAAHRAHHRASSASPAGPTSAGSSAVRRCRCASASSSTPHAASAPAPRGSCSPSCCPTSSRRSSSTPRC